MKTTDKSCHYILRWLFKRAPGSYIPPHSFIMHLWWAIRVLRFSPVRDALRAFNVQHWPVTSGPQRCVVSRSFQAESKDLSSVFLLCHSAPFILRKKAFPQGCLFLSISKNKITWWVNLSHPISVLPRSSEWAYFSQKPYLILTSPTRFQCSPSFLGYNKFYSLNI